MIEMEVLAMKPEEHDDRECPRRNHPQTLTAIPALPPPHNAAFYTHTYIITINIWVKSIEEKEVVLEKMGKELWHYRNIELVIVGEREMVV